ncbi:MAG TPA: hypothetical protein V6D03_12070, partial [Candidatus Caenarcaniphilales bacterium]
MNFAVLLKKIFQSQDLNQVTRSIEALQQCLPDEQVSGVISEALGQTLNEDPATFAWLTQVMVAPETLVQLGEVATQKATEQLIAQGFEVGKDFVVHPEGSMIANKSS